MALVNIISTDTNQYAFVANGVTLVTGQIHKKSEISSGCTNSLLRVFARTSDTHVAVFNFRPLLDANSLVEAISTAIPNVIDWRGAVYITTSEETATSLLASIQSELENFASVLFDRREGPIVQIETVIKPSPEKRVWTRWSSRRPTGPGDYRIRTKSKEETTVHIQELGSPKHTILHIWKLVCFVPFHEEEYINRHKEVWWRKLN